jgi:hypothetical protein
MTFDKGQEAILLEASGTWCEVVIIDYDGGGYWNIKQGDVIIPVPEFALAIRGNLPNLRFVPLSEVAKKNNVNKMTVWTWLWKLHIEPHYVGESKDPLRKGVMAVLDESQQKQLQDWLDKRGAK